MNTSHSLARTRCLCVALLACAITVPLGLGLSRLMAPDDGGRPGAELVRICAGLLLLCLVWAWAAVIASVVDAWQGAPARELAGVPSWLRRLVLLGCGVALAGGMATPVQAVGGVDAPASGAGSTAVLTGLPLPDRASSTGWARGEPAPRPVAAAGSAEGRRHLIAPGETLWGIAAASLDPDAPAEAVEARWREIHRLNRAAIGEDPDLIHPGTRLVLPREGAPR